MANQVSPSGFGAIVRGPVTDKGGTASTGFLQLMRDWNTRITNSMDLKGHFIGVLSILATVDGRPGTLSEAIQNLTPTGQLPSSALTGALPSGLLPPSGIGSLGGVAANNPVPNEWINSIDTSGNPQLSQPGFGNIAGVASPAQVPALSALSGAVTPAQCPTLSNLNGQITTGQLPPSGISGTVTLAKLTGGGTNGSLTYTNGIITAVVNPT